MPCQIAKLRSQRIMVENTKVRPTLVRHLLRNRLLSLNGITLSTFVSGKIHPDEYIAFLVDNSQVHHQDSHYHAYSPGGRMRRFWWESKNYVGKCAKLKIVDNSAAQYGWVIFDDLRASPPCFKGNIS